MSNLEKDIKQALDIVMGYNQTELCKDYSKCFMNTSENIKDYMKYLDGDYEKALLPTASGDHALEAMLSGITDITCYDINKLAKYFVKLKFAALNSLSKEEFINYIYENICNKEILNYIKYNLDDNTYLFWNELFNKSSKEYIYFRLFRLMGICDNKGNVINNTSFSKYCSQKFVTYLDDNNYKKVQEKMKNTKIRYLDGNILDIATLLEDNYDLINLTNIYSYINDDPYKDSAEMFSKCVLNLIDKLNKDGKILLTYLYKYTKKDFKKYSTKTIKYLTFIRFLMTTPIGRSNFNYSANRHGRKNLLDKAYLFRDTQFTYYLKDLNIETYEVEKVGLGRRDYRCDCDMALVYTKK